jgi:hypothetical protein
MIAQSLVPSEPALLLPTTDSIAAEPKCILSLLMFEIRTAFIRLQQEIQFLLIGCTLEGADWEIKTHKPREIHEFIASKEKCGSNGQQWFCLHSLTWDPPTVKDLRRTPARVSLQSIFGLPKQQ